MQDGWSQFRMAWSKSWQSYSRAWISFMYLTAMAGPLFSWHFSPKSSHFHSPRYRYPPIYSFFLFPIATVHLERCMQLRYLGLSHYVGLNCKQSLTALGLAMHELILVKHSNFVWGSAYTVLLITATSRVYKNRGNIHSISTLKSELIHLLVCVKGTVKIWAHYVQKHLHSNSNNAWAVSPIHQFPDSTGNCGISASISLSELFALAW